MMQQLLRRLGHQAEMTEDGRQALEAWRCCRYALVLTDCRMPVMDGFALAQAIRQEETSLDLPRTPIIAFCGTATPHEIEACINAGMDDFISKPVRLDGLREVLGRWIR
jgi:CheY-like chemotaxis protein